MQLSGGLHGDRNVALGLKPLGRLFLPSVGGENKMGSSEPRVAGDRTAGMNGGATTVVDKGVDFANYFCTYAFLYHQKEMLSDRVRMDAYYNAIFENKHHFRGKVCPFSIIS